jgi:hypothetical protein
MLQWQSQRVASAAERRKAEQPCKRCPTSDRVLKTAPVKPESQVIVYQQGTVNMFQILYTPPVTPWESAVLQAGPVRARKEPFGFGRFRRQCGLRLG